MTNSVTQANLNELRSLSESLSNLFGVSGVGFDASSSSVINVGNNTFTIAGHGFNNGDAVTYYKNANSDGTSSTAVSGLTNATTYYVIAVSGNSFKLSGASNGTAIDITSLGTGNQFFVKADQNVVNSVSDASKIDLLYRRIQDARRLAYSDIDSNASAIFNNLLAALDPVSAAYNKYLSGSVNVYQLLDALQTLSATTPSTGGKAKIGQFQALLDTFDRSWSIQDRVFYEYSKTGEADLNNQLGQLGDALDTLSRAIQIINKVDMALSVNPRNSSNVSLVKADSTLESNFYSDGVKDLLIPTTSISVDASSISAINTSNETISATNHGFSNGDRVILNSSGSAPGNLTNGNTYYIVGVSGNNFKLSATSGGAAIDISTFGSGYLTLTKQVNAMKYAYSAAQELMQISGGFTPGTAVRSAIDTVLGTLSTHGVTSSNWANAVDPNVSGAATPWRDASYSFKSFWEDPALRRQVNDLQTNLSSQNDVEKQNLRKAMFIYQEFIKSAGTVMDRVYDAIKGIASRIGR